MRYVPRKLQEIDDDGRVLGLMPAAFALRPGEDYISVNWLEYFENTHASNVASCKAGLQAVLKGSKAVFGVAEVGRVKSLAAHNEKPVRIVYYPNADCNPSHSAVFMNLPVADTMCEDLAREFNKERY